MRAVIVIAALVSVLLFFVDSVYGTHIVPRVSRCKNLLLDVFQRLNRPQPVAPPHSTCRSSAPPPRRPGASFGVTPAPTCSASCCAGVGSAGYAGWGCGGPRPGPARGAAGRPFARPSCVSVCLGGAADGCAHVPAASPPFSLCLFSTLRLYAAVCSAAKPSAARNTRKHANTAEARYPPLDTNCRMRV